MLTDEERDQCRIESDSPDWFIRTFAETCLRLDAELAAALAEVGRLRSAVREWMNAGNGGLEAYNEARNKLRALVADEKGEAQ